MKNVLLLMLFPFITAINLSNKTPFKKVENSDINKKNVEEKVREVVVRNNDFQEAHIVEKVKDPNVNEILWLWHKYKIRPIYSHCLMNEAERKAQNDQQSEIFLKHGNLFWVTVNNEVDSIERNNLGYKKANLEDLEKYLKRNHCTTYIPTDISKVHAAALVDFKLNENGKLSNININAGEYPKIPLGNNKSKGLKLYLSDILNKAPKLEPSKFLNKPIEDSAFIRIVVLNQ